MSAATRIRSLYARDIRFPTSLKMDGSDAAPDPDYSCAYVVIYTDSNLKGEGLAFTIGRGTELVVAAVKALSPVVVGKKLSCIFTNFSETWRELASDSQMRWVGPEKGVIHLATAAIVNALWDLWAKLLHKPLWKLLVDMTPEQLVGTIDFRYITDALTKEEAIQMLREMEDGKAKREEEVIERGYPAYVSAAGWMGYSEFKIEEKCERFVAEGWNHFKIRVGQNLEDDKRRCALFRKILGNDRVLMVDANQKWGVDEAIERMKELAPYKPIWIEEPTSPDDVLGHAKIAKALAPLGIGVATGEMCQNRVIFKQLLQADAISYCQIDAARLGGVPEVLSVYLMAKKFGVPVCPHGGGVGLCEMVQHLQVWDYISLSGTMENRRIEYADHMMEYIMKFPRRIKHSSYVVPMAVGYTTAMWEKSLVAYEYPYGSAWKKLFSEGKFEDPTKETTFHCLPLQTNNNW